MLRLTIISVLIAVAVARTPAVRPAVPMFDGRIVGGEDATIEEIPYQLSLQSSGSHMCGASILSPTKVLTAAHCTDGARVEYLTIRAGTAQRGSGGQVVGVKSIDQHPGYTRHNIDKDVSILELASPLIFGSGVQKIELVAPSTVPAPGTLATVSGWGTLSSGGGSLPNTLQKVQVPHVDLEKCRDLYGRYEVTENMICFGFDQGGKDSCQGDSGGPLVSGGKQVGVVSWGLGCAAAGYPGVYANLAAPAIAEHINKSL